MTDLKNLPTVEELVSHLEEYQRDSIEGLKKQAKFVMDQLRLLHDTLGGSIKLEGNELLARSSVAEVTDIEIQGSGSHHGMKEPVQLFRMYLETSRGQFNLLNGTTRELEPGTYRVLTFFVKMPDSQPAPTVGSSVRRG